MAKANNKTAKANNKTAKANKQPGATAWLIVSWETRARTVGVCFSEVDAIATVKLLTGRLASKAADLKLSSMTPRWVNAVEFIQKHDAAFSGIWDAEYAHIEVPLFR